MSNCNCCNPNCAPPCPGDSAPEGYDTTHTGDKVLVADDNGAPRGLKGEGVLVRQDESAYHTKGSARDGEIKLNPEAIGAGDQLLVLAAGVLKALIAAENEGKVLVVQGGKFTLVNPTEARTTFNSADLPEFTDSLAALGCGPNGTIRLGRHRVTPKTFLYYNEEGKLVALPEIDATKLFLSLICGSATVLGPAEAIKYGLGCTDAGDVRKFLPFTHAIYHVRPFVTIINQATPGNIPPSPGPVFTPVSTNFDYRTVTGYDEKYTTAILDLLIAGYAGTRNFDLYIVIDGVEYGRARLGQPLASDSVNNQILVPIPVGKISNVQALEYTNAPGTYGPTAVVVNLAGFMI